MDEVEEDAVLNRALERGTRNEVSVKYASRDATGMTAEGKRRSRRFLEHVEGRAVCVRRAASQSTMHKPQNDLCHYDLTVVNRPTLRSTGGATDTRLHDWLRDDSTPYGEGDHAQDPYR